MKIETVDGKVRINGIETGCVSVREARRKMPGLFEAHCGVCNVRWSLHDARTGHEFTFQSHNEKEWGTWTGGKFTPKKEGGGR